MSEKSKHIVKMVFSSSEWNCFLHLEGVAFNNKKDADECMNVPKMWIDERKEGDCFLLDQFNKKGSLIKTIQIKKYYAMLVLENFQIDDLIKERYEEYLEVCKKF